jgi:hypothetical protein
LRRPPRELTLHFPLPLLIIHSHHKIHHHHPRQDMDITLVQIPSLFFHNPLVHHHKQQRRATATTPIVAPPTRKRVAMAIIPTKTPPNRSHRGRPCRQAPRHRPQVTRTTRRRPRSPTRSLVSKTRLLALPLRVILPLHRLRIVTYWILRSEGSHRSTQPRRQQQQLQLHPRQRSI